MSCSIHAHMKAYLFLKENCKEQEPKFVPQGLGGYLVSAQTCLTKKIGQPKYRSMFCLPMSYPTLAINKSNAPELANQHFCMPRKLATIQTRTKFLVMTKNCHDYQLELASDESLDLLCQSSRAAQNCYVTNHAILVYLKFITRFVLFSYFTFLESLNTIVILTDFFLLCIKDVFRRQ